MPALRKESLVVTRQGAVAEDPQPRRAWHGGGYFMSPCAVIVSRLISQP
jgi:hypothetical protein